MVKIRNVFFYSLIFFLGEAGVYENDVEKGVLGKFDIYGGKSMYYDRAYPHTIKVLTENFRILQMNKQGWPEAANIWGCCRIFVMRVKFFSNRTQKKIFGFAGKKRKFSIIGGLSQPPQPPSGPPL
jgi:hypothetical protein